LGFGVGGWGFGVWGLGPTPQSPIPNPQSPIPILFVKQANKLNKIKIIKK